MAFKPIAEVQLPTFNMAHITNYFISRITVDGKSAGDFKNLNSRAFPLFKDGHVQNITASARDELIIFRAKCLPEMKKCETYSIELSQHKVSTDIQSASCGCTAGCGPKGSCKHIAALCYALEEFCRIKKTQEYTACTSKLQEWNQPRKRTLDPQNVDAIKFVKLEHGKSKREHFKAVYDPRPQHQQYTSKEEMKSFYETLQSFNKPCGFLHVITLASSSSALSPTNLPLVPRSTRERVLVRMRAMDHPLSQMQIHTLGEAFVDGITPSSQEAKAIEEATRRQFACKRWHEERYCRITSSKFGEICKSRSSIAKCKRMLYSNTSSTLSSAALLWGRDHESQAREDYTKRLGEGWSVEECGLHVSTLRGYLGASPDGLVCCAGKVCGCIEIKCPFSARDKLVGDACMKSQFFCTKDENNVVTLKRNHNYYYQIQGQLSVLKLEWCDFVVWTNVDLHVERIKADEKFWCEKCLPQLSSFYYNIMLPEIIYPRYSLALNIIDYTS